MRALLAAALVLIGVGSVLSQPLPVCCFDFQAQYTNLTKLFSVEQNGWTVSGITTNNAIPAPDEVRVTRLVPYSLDWNASVLLNHAYVSATSNAFKEVGSTISVYFSVLLDGVNVNNNEPAVKTNSLFSRTSTNQVFDTIYTVLNGKSQFAPLSLVVNQQQETTFSKKVKLHFLQFVVVCRALTADNTSQVWCNGRELTDIPTEPIPGTLPPVVISTVNKVNLTNVFQFGTPEAPFPATLIKFEVYKGTLSETDIVNLCSPPNVGVSFHYRSYQVGTNTISRLTLLERFRPEWWTYEMAYHSDDCQTWTAIKNSGVMTKDGLLSDVPNPAISLYLSQLISLYPFDLLPLQHIDRRYFLSVELLPPFPLVDIDSTAL